VSIAKSLTAATGPVRLAAAFGALLLVAACSSGGIDPTIGAFDEDVIYASLEDGGIEVPAVGRGEFNPQFARREVRTPGHIPNEPGTIVVDTRARYLYLVEADGKSMRYGIGVGREGFAWAGTATIKSKQRWPRWVPPREMVERDPAARPYAGGMPGGIENPLGARALYLFDGNRDTLFRLHGTNDPGSIGKAMSSGCVRLINQDVIDLYERVPLGTKVVVLGDPDLLPTSSPGRPVVETLFPSVPPPLPPKNVGQG
jgi:lipoprotein-anchoring transpeptidase ErfK/SrfK